MSTKKIMISSTAHDLPEHRRAVSEACRVLKHNPVMMEDLAALDADAIEASLAMVDEADVYLGIFAHRYGHIPQRNNPDGISITEMEYRRALEKRKPRLIFIVAEDHVPGLEHEQNREAAYKLTEFKKRVMGDRVVKFFTSPDHLRALVTEALAALERQGTQWMPEPLPDDPGYLPADGDVPPGSRVLVGRAEFFVGREDMLVEIAQSLLHSADTEAKAVIKPAVATGAGGIGKTVLAVEFAHRYGRYFYGVHWINLFGITGGDLEAHLRTEIAANGQRMNLPGFPADLPSQVQMTLDVWRNTPPRLLILDNAENPGVVKQALRMFPWMRVLVTSRWGEDGDWRVIGVTPRPLDTLTRHQSLILLRKLAPHLHSVPDEALNRLAARLGDYPLALHLAGRYIDRMRRAGGISIDDYLRRLESEGMAHPAFSQAERMQDPALAQHHGTVAHCLGLSWEHVTDPLAQQLFRACGYLAPNTPIPPDMLLAFAGGREVLEDETAQRLKRLVDERPGFGDQLRALLNDEAAFADMVQRMGGGDVDHIARLTRRVLDGEYEAQKDRTAEDLALALTQLVQYGLLAPYTGDTTHTNEVPVSDAAGEQLAIHPLLADFARGLDASLPPEEQQLPHVARMVNILSYRAGGTGLPSNFAPLRPHVEVVAERAEIAQLEDAGPLWNNLGYYERMIANYPGTRQYYQRALEVDERKYGPEDSKVAIRLNNLGRLAQELGDLTSAHDYYQRALTIFQRVYQGDNPNTAAALNNLGAILRAQGNIAEARRLYESSLAMRERMYGRDHSDVAQSLNNLGRIFYDEGDLDTARDHFQQALRIDERIYGSNHPDVAIDFNNLGNVYHKMGELDVARDYQERALRIDERVYGPNHPNVAIDLNNLGTLAYDQGDLHGAIHYFDRALRIWQAKLPPGHPDMVMVQRHLQQAQRDLARNSPPTVTQLRYFLASLPGERRQRGG